MENEKNFVERAILRDTHSYNERALAGEYKPLDSSDLDGCKEPLHLYILTDEYLYELLDKVRYGIPLTLQEAGDLIGVTRERVRQNEKSALRKLRKKYTNKLKDLFYRKDLF